MIRIRRALEIFQVATDASRICAAQIVVAIHMALRALHAGVCPGQWESGCGVVECRARPVGCGVALLAGLRESRLHMVRIGGAVEILYVAGCAIRGRPHELAVDMTLRARHANVGAG